VSPEPKPADQANDAAVEEVVQSVEEPVAEVSVPGGLRPISKQARKSLEEDSASLLLDLNTLRVSQRKTRVYGIVGLLSVLLVGVVTGVVIFMVLDDDTRANELRREVAEAQRRAEESRGRRGNVDKLRTYSKEELALLVVNLGEEEVGGSQPVLEGGDAGIAGGDNLPDAGAPGLDASTNVSDLATGGRADGVGRVPKKRDLGLGSKSGLDKALADAVKTDRKGVRVNEDRPVAATGDRAKIDVKRGGTHLPSVGSKGGFLSGAGGTAIEGREKASDDKAAAAKLPPNLTRADLLAGFKSVRRSARHCLERSLKAQVPLPKSKVKVTVTILGSGRVDSVSMDQAVRNTPFGACMKSHRGRWKFPRFGGRPMQVSKIFVLQ
jgi:hypothetical protein